MDLLLSIMTCMYLFIYFPNTTLFVHRPLHLAARNGLATVVQALLSRGATVLAVDEEGEQHRNLDFSVCFVFVFL